MKSSKETLKRKIGDLRKQAEEIEALGVELSGCANFGERREGGGVYTTLDYDISSLKKIQREAIQKYQQWYSTSLQLIGEYTPEWLNEFKLHYEHLQSLSVGVMEYLKLDVYTRFSERVGAITEFVDEFGAQLAILLSIPPLLKSKRWV